MVQGKAGKIGSIVPNAAAETAASQAVVVTHAPPLDLPESRARGWRRLFSAGPIRSTSAASLLTMGAALCSSALGLLRSTLVAHYFGPGPQTAAYFAAFQLPDQILYLLIGGAGSAAFVSILNRHQENGTEAEGDEARSVVLNVLSSVLMLAVLLGEVFTPAYVRAAFPDFQRLPAEFALCVHATRILLIGPLFFFTGSVFGSRLLVRKIFVYQAAGTVLYSAGSVLGALLLHRRFGISSLAIGAMAGALCSPLLNIAGARRIGMRWSPLWQVRHPAVWQWLRLSLPLMLGVSLTTTDQWIRNWLISGDPANFSRLQFARQIFSAPMNVLGPAAGIASLPFFAALWAKGQVPEFSAAVDRSVSRMIAVSVLLSGWMIALAPLLLAFVLRGGSFAASDTATTTRYFVAYTVALFLWTSQNLYARAFYGAGDTLTPMISGTVVTLVSIPVYWLLYHALGPEGLAWAAGVGMLAHTGALAVLLHRRRMVSLAELDFAEIGRALLASILAGLLLIVLRLQQPAVHGKIATLLVVGAFSLVWAAVVFGVLHLSGSRLPDIVLRRKRMG